MMNNFLIIDDNLEQSDLVKENLLIEFQNLHVEFGIIEMFPFSTAEREKYFSFIADNSVCVVILDEKLNDQKNKEGFTVDYLGHNLVSFLREREKDIPIYTVTNYSANSDVQNMFREYDQVINRRDFIDHTDKYVPVMLRAAKKFIDRYSNILSEYSRLSEEVASGDDSNKKIERLRAIQSALELPLVGFDDRKIWLKEYETQIESLQKLKGELIKKINDDLEKGNKKSI